MRGGENVDHDYQNVVLFPKRQQEMEDKAFRALQEKRYKEALKTFDSLLYYGIDRQEITLGKLTCFIELGKQEEAEEMCEELIARKDQDYYSYIHIYATLLFQAHKYQQVAEELEEVLTHKNIPEPFHAQLEKLHQVNQNLMQEQVEEHSISTKRELEEAIRKEDTIAQWHLLNHLHQTNLKTYLNLFQEMLVNDKVHPVIKSVIVGLLQSESIDLEIEVEKFKKKMSINPNTYPYMTDHPFRKQLRQSLENLEQENPSFYTFAEQLMDRYFYVNYPFAPDLSKVSVMKQALLALVQISFDPDQTIQEDYYDKEIAHQINDIIQCEQIYFSIMEE